MKLLYLSAGHGGADSGASGNGLQEKDIVLDMVLRLRDLLAPYELSGCAGPGRRLPIEQ